VDAYLALHQAAFQSENMTCGWRHTILQHPAYRPELDLVIEAPDGRLAAFCIGWFAHNAFADQPCDQIEPLGVHADFRQRGLAKALLSACFQCMHHLGAQRVLVGTDNDCDAAFHLYEAVGFRVQHAVLVYRKDYGPQE
jgi:ribosomal protein S18 acetylase RimI-like enzyme